MTAITTAAQAARRAVAWAMSAEDPDKAARNLRRQGDDWAARRGHHSNAANWYEQTEGWGQAREKAVAMVNMWANIAGVLHLADDGESS